MNEHRKSVRGGEPEHFNHLVSRGTRRVLEAQTNTERTRFDLAPKRGKDPIQTLGSGRLARRGTGLRNYSGLGPKYAGRQRHIPGEETCRQVRGGRTEMDETAPSTRIDKTADVGNADFELQSGSHPVQRHEAIRIGGLPVLVQIDEPRRDEEAARVDGPRASQRFGGNSRNRVAANSDVADAVQVGLGINDAARLQYDIKGFRSPRARPQPA